ncbi:hypothetical protein SAMN05216480_105229 [Pustulibacterium marinum]|uniref:Tetratricopeptide repeat-containing protein n=1 Tax=Pustulibacterium marinum TaxID=1224947 RepID=A0A1I7GSA7_9FLAO|nr:tetratricopeptide repeat protein [Pustulibacterium marinum]SFU51314.1 hypothetical protein SAMN05216480_105229 [Pustulibacterium marinum]
MNITKVTYLLQHPEAITSEDTAALNAFVKEYPYFQAARALQLKGLFNQDSFHYNKSLKITAAYTTDRSLLFDFINSKVFHQNKASQKIAKHQSKLNDISVIAEEVRAIKDVFNEDDYKSSNSVMDPEIFQPKKKNEEQHRKEKDENLASETVLKIGKPLDFNNERHSFSEWLQLSKHQPISREVSEPETENNLTEEESSEINRSPNFDLIDRFLEKSPKIVPSKEIINNKNLAKEATSEKNQLMTETLARVYLEQKKYKKAIQAYQILILKYPEKSSLFADQISAIKKLQQNN